MEDEGPVLAQVLGTQRGRRLVLAIEAELCALVAATVQGRAKEPEAQARSGTKTETETEEEPGRAEDRRRRRSKVGVVFAGLGGYGRLLVHKTAERFDGLESFSIGGAGDQRRTVVLARSGSTTPFLRYADFVAKAPPTKPATPPPPRHASQAETKAVGLSSVSVMAEEKDTSTSASAAASSASATEASNAGARTPARPFAGRGVYVPPSRRRGQAGTDAQPGTGTPVGSDGGGRGVYVPPSRRRREDSPQGDATARRDEQTALAASDPGNGGSPARGAEGDESERPTTKRRRGRGFQQEARQRSPFDEACDSTMVSRGDEQARQRSAWTTDTKQRDNDGYSHHGDGDDELEDELERHDAELKPLTNELAFAEWVERPRASEQRESSGGAWASLARGRRDRRSEPKRGHDEEPDLEVVVHEHPDHVMELYDVEPSTSDQDLVSLLSDAAGGDLIQQAVRLRRTSRTTALVAFASDLEAREAAARLAGDESSDRCKIRPLAHASPESRDARGVALELARSVVPRPPADARVARRMLTHALGLSPKRQDTIDE